MANIAQKYDILNPKHINPKSVTFSVFTADEIRKISTVEIVTPVLFDSLGNPVSGGLYDKRLGPMSEKSDPCGVCNKNSYSCPGHFGHITLPLPLVNPLFHKIIATVLKISCLSCYKIQIPSHIKKCIEIQLTLLDSGLVTESQEVENIILDLIAQFETFENIPEENTDIIKKYEKLAKKTKDKVFINKNVEALRNEFLNNMFKEIKTSKSCKYCRTPINTMKIIKNKIILNQPKLSQTIDHNSSFLTKVRAMESKYVTPEESKKYMRSIYNEEKVFLRKIISVLNNVDIAHPTDIFFFEVIPVPPTNVRPVNIVNGRIAENPQTSTYKQILFNILTLKTTISYVQNKTVNISDQAKDLYKSCKGTSPVEKLNNSWEELQNDVNGLIDKDSIRSKDGMGLKQIIEKKTGVIRMHMMGKRVNYAARSVITPDPNLNIDEIGIPETFAKHLTYPVPVTMWNVEEMRKLIMNGPNVHPGATMIEFEDGKITRINTSNATQQESLLKRLLTPDKDTAFKGVKIVHRHLQNGDVLLLNRQPTLHKPSIMAHTARILKGEKTLRLHYANCKAYNADFDGDEMNAHFPQNELARSEGYNLANVSNQYLVPKDGTPLSGLIQDHMIAGVKMSLRGRFFSRIDYQQLVYQALSYKTGEIKLLPPTILKPYELYSGKQILSTVLMNVIPKDRAKINMTSSTKIPPQAWEVLPPRKWLGGGSPLKNANDMTEAEVIIREGEFLVGVLDKTHYGATAYGLVHCLYELYGGTYAIRFLSCLAKLFTNFLQQEGFTLGVKDILTFSKADKKRTKIIEKSRKIGRETITNALDLPLDTEENEIVKEIEKRIAVNPKLRATIDREYKSSLNNYTNDINKVCLPAGLICKFPQNNLQLMVQSGAKGSTVNTMQISCLLGQIELEGKRPPVMISGKSLPSFPDFEFSPRAGGFIDGRFMTGIQPQEFFFHCMAGREGLIDTAVKTSRSGYLQRCLIKHLEGLHVGYDMTVRDSDKSVIQFMYGEDGMEIAKSQFLNEKQFQFLNDNKKVLKDKDVLKKLQNDDGYGKVVDHLNEIKEWREKFGGNNNDNNSKKSPFSLFSTVIKNKFGKTIDRNKTTKLWEEADETLKNAVQCIPCPDPVNALYQADSNFGSINERLETLIDKFNAKLIKEKDKSTFENILKLKAMQSYCNPGEPVGLLAAQSIGEPSTQMTLNTFHFAGRGDMNVTLGIPRLREILMMASKNIKTPSMEVPFLNVPNLEERAENLRKRLTRVVVADVLEDIDVAVQLNIPLREYTYTLKFKFLPKYCYKDEFNTNPKQILKHLRKKFFTEMFSAILKFSRIKSNIVMMEEQKSKPKNKTNNDDSDGEDDNTKTKDNNSKNNDDSSDEEIEDSEDAKMTTKHDEVHEDQEPDNEEKEKDSDDEIEEDENLPQSETDEKTVVGSFNFAQNYLEDKESHLWSELTFALPLKFKKLDLSTILKEVANKSVIWETTNIKRAITYMKDDILTLRTDGINIAEMYKYNTLLNLNKIYTNDIHEISKIYGIEAASRVIVKEVKEVFGVYGIKVDPRHLSLVADYMTYNGTFEPLSRKGMESSSSPLLQMSFESSLTFLKNACARGKKDDLQTPSSCLMVGKPCNTGTGSFSLIHKLPTLIKS